LSATLGLDDSAYRQGIQNVQSETKKTVSSLSGEYSKAAKAVVELTRRYNESVGKTGKASSETKNLKTMLAQAEAQLRATTTALKAANNGMDGFASSTDKASGKSLAGAIAQGTVMANVFSELGSAALRAAEGFISSGIEYNAQIESYTVGLTNMLGSAEAAQQAIDQIQQDAARTPFSVEALTQANQLLIGAGENATYAEKTIMALGNAVSATGGSNAELSRMAANLQQIANVGKASAIDIKQFAYAGINIYGLLADYTGKSTAEVQKMTISYDLLTQALQAASEEGGRYYGSMDTQSQTMNGRVSTLQDNVKQLAGLMTGDLSSGVGVVISNLNDLVVKAQEAYKTDGWIGLAGAITGLSGPISSVKSWFEGFASSASTWLDKLSYKLNRFLGKAATADFDTYEEYADANNRQSNRNRLRQNALKGIGISNKSWSERQAELAAANGNGGSSVRAGGGSGSSGRKKSGSKSTTETVISSISSTATTTAQNALGTVTTSIQTLTEKVKDSSGKIKDRITETTTTTGKEMVNGVATTFKQVETKVNGTVTKVTKTYDDMSKTLLGTFTNVSETTFNGITTKVQQAVEKYADGSEHIKKTVTETGQRIGENGSETYEKIITYIDGIQDKVNETSTLIDKSVKGTQSRIDQQLSEASGQLDKGIFGLVKNAFSDAKNGDWGGLALDFVNLIWGEVSQEQRDVISKWLADALTAVNEGYFSGGIGKALGSIQSIFTNGITAGVDGATTSVKVFSEIVQGLAGSGGVGGALGSIVQSFSGMAGGITSALGGIVSFVAANPVLALILGVGAAGAVAGGIGLAMWMNKKNDQQPVSHYQSPFDKTGVYDSLSEFSTRSAMQYRVTGQQSIVDRQTSILERIEGMLDEHLPDIGKGQVVMDSGELVGVLSPRMANNVDLHIGVAVTRKARGV
jgi:tape measure domain-containing protein